MPPQINASTNTGGASGSWTPDKVVDIGNGQTVAFPGEMDDLTIATHVKQHLATGGTDAGTVAPSPLAEKMKQEAGRQAGPQHEIERWGTPEEKERFESGMEMSAPMAVAGGLATSPIKTIATKGVGGYVKPLIKAVLKSWAGQKAGEYVGGPTGGIIGGLAGPFISGRTFAKLPLVGRIASSAEEYADVQAERKLAQKMADEKIGLRKPEPSFESESAGHNVPLGPSAPTEDEKLTRAIKEGKAARLPSRIAVAKEKGIIAEAPAAERGVSSAEVRPATTEPVSGKDNTGLGPTTSRAPGQPEVKLTTRMQAAKEAAQEEESNAIEGAVPTPKGRMVLLPEEARTQERFKPLIKARESERGHEFAAGFVPAEGRKVPQRPMQTETEEYGGPRTEEQQQKKQSLLEKMGARIKKPFLPGGETGAFKVGGEGEKLSQKMGESSKASQLVKSAPEDWTGDDGKPRIVDGIHPDYYRYPSSVIEPDGTSYSGEEHSTIDESGLSNQSTRVRIIRSTHEIGIDVDDPKNITPEQLKILASESKGKQTIYFDHGTGGSEEFRTFGDFQRFLDKIRGKK